MAALPNTSPWMCCEVVGTRTCPRPPVHDFLRKRLRLAQCKAQVGSSRTAAPHSHGRRRGPTSLRETSEGPAKPLSSRDASPREGWRGVFCRTIPMPVAAMAPLPLVRADLQQQSSFQLLGG